MSKRYYKNYKPDIYKYSDEDNSRYVLGNEGKKPLICIGINPNDACLEYGDPTMIHLINISKAQGYDSCIMINPYPVRMAKPSSLPPKFEQKILNTNYKYIEEVFKDNHGSDTLVMWGNYIDKNVDFKDAVFKILNLAAKYSMNMVCISDNSKKQLSKKTGKNNGGNPYHFQYLKRKKIISNDTYKFVSFDANEYMKKK